MYTPNRLLSRLVGCRLYSVQFVMDYVQLQFDRTDTSDQPVLNCDVWPETRRAETIYHHGDLGYADALTAFIPEDVVATAEGTGVGVEVRFPSGSIVLHPAREELVGPEIAMLSGFADGDWMVWRPGEDSFEDLA